jgi:hypothetical protein
MLIIGCGFLLLTRLQNLVQLHLNRTFDQLSPRTPPAIVSRERRAAHASPPPSPSTTPTTVPNPTNPIASTLLPMQICRTVRRVTANKPATWRRG